MTYAIGFSEIVGQLGQMFVGVFGSPLLAGIFLFAIIGFFMVKFRLPTDAMIGMFAFTIVSLFVMGIARELFLPMVIIMLGIVGYAIVKLVKR